MGTSCTSTPAAFLANGSVIKPKFNSYYGAISHNRSVLNSKPLSSITPHAAIRQTPKLSSRASC